APMSFCWKDCFVDQVLPDIERPRRATMKGFWSVVLSRVHSRFVFVSTVSSWRHGKGISPGYPARNEIPRFSQAFSMPGRIGPATRWRDRGRGWARCYGANAPATLGK